MSKQTPQWNPVQDFLTPLADLLGTLAQASDPRDWPERRLTEGYHKAWYDDGADWLQRKYRKSYAEHVIETINKPMSALTAWWSAAGEEKETLKWQRAFDKRRAILKQAEKGSKAAKQAAQWLKDFAAYAPKGLPLDSEGIDPQTGFSYRLMQAWEDIPLSATLAQRKIEILLQAEAKESERAGKKDGRRKISKDIANKRAIQILGANPKIGIKKLAAKIGCSTGLVSYLDCWQKQKAQEYLASGKKRRLSKRLQLVLGKDDPELQRLMGEQAADLANDKRMVKMYPARRQKPRSERLDDEEDE